MEENDFDGLSLIGAAVSAIGISAKAQDIINESWRTNTKKQYKTYLSRWRLFCSGRGLDPLRFSVNHIIEFLTYLVVTVQ